MTVIPAYGRDYKSAKAAKTDWLAGKDFIVADAFNQWCGKYVSIRDVPNEEIYIRYAKLTKVCKV